MCFQLPSVPKNHLRKILYISISCSSLCCQLLHSVHGGTCSNFLIHFSSFKIVKRVVYVEIKLLAYLLVFQCKVYLVFPCT